jgi:protein-S-isoprenylcysteine O-methyltransferase Ste14
MAALEQAPASRLLIDWTVDAALAATLIGWSVVGLTRGSATSAVGISLVALNIVVGLLFLTRASARRHATWRQLAACLPSVLIGPVAMSVAPPAETWALGWQALFVAATAGLLISLATLGRSFSVLPALRSVVNRGPYRLVRHPIYACEMAMVMAACGASSSWLGVMVIVAAIVTIVVRIGVEERMLEAEPAYRRLRVVVRHRLVPGLW